MGRPSTSGTWAHGPPTVALCGQYAAALCGQYAAVLLRHEAARGCARLYRHSLVIMRPRAGIGWPGAFKADYIIPCRGLISLFRLLAEENRAFDRIIISKTKTDSRSRFP